MTEKIYTTIKKETALKILTQKEESQTIYVTENIVGYKHLRCIDVAQDEIILDLTLPFNAVVFDIDEPDMVEIVLKDNDYIIVFNSLSDYEHLKKLGALLVVEP